MEYFLAPQSFLYLLSLALLVFQVLLSLPVMYLVFLTFLALRAPRFTPPAGGEHAVKFAFLIPAHDEEQLLPACLESLFRLDYPRSMFDIHVVADNCSDQTAEIAAAMGAQVHVRKNPNLLGKGYALQHGLQQIWESGLDYHGIVVLDADTIVSENFLAVMASRLARGERIIQAFYTAARPERSWNESLRFAALAAVHYLRPLARTALGGSCGLKGNGMVFVPEILRAHAWTAALTEDIEYHMALLLAGERVYFAPDAVVWGEMPTSLKNARSQHDRWERGRLQAALKYPPLLAAAAVLELKSRRTGRAVLLLDAAMENLIPPLSILAGMSLAGLAAAAGLLVLAWSTAPSAAGLATAALVWGAVTLLGLAGYVLVSLRLVRAPQAVYKSLFYAPVLVIWKFAQYVRVITARRPQGWVRTARNER